MLIEKYTPNWVKDFTNVKREIESGLQGSHYVVEHVGSTSVPNLDAKPIIDIDVVYTDQADFDSIKLGLEKLGYFHNGNQGIEGRDVFKRNEKWGNEVLDTVKHHLYVCQIGAKALLRHTLFRDFLRANDWARLEYQQMKYKLAEMAKQDKKKYAELKELNINDFIDSVIEKEKMNRSHSLEI